MAAVKGTRNEIHTAKLRNKATVLGMCLFLLKKPKGSDQAQKHGKRLLTNWRTLILERCFWKKWDL